MSFVKKIRSLGREEKLEKMKTVFEKTGFAFEGSINTRKGEIYLGERYANGSEDMPAPHISTLWMAYSGQALALVARECKHNIQTGMLTKDQRLKMAEENAMEFLNGRPSR